MGLKWVCVCAVLLMFLSLEGRPDHGCSDEDRFALLQLRHFFNDPYYLRDWVEGEQNSDCCKWKRVTCSNTTGRVVELYLDHTRNQDQGEWYLNVSLFSSFQKLETLFLEDNLIVGCVENEGFERLSHLNNLNVLNLNDNLFNNSILSSVTTLSSLKELYISNIGLKGTFDVRELDPLRNLEVLKIGGNEIDKFVFPKGSNESDKGLRKLKSFFLWDVNITDGSNLLQSLGSFPLLKRVELVGINFTGTAVSPSRELQNFSNVEELFFYGSSLHVSLLPSIGAFTSLERLVMIDCELNGILANQDFPTLKNLKHLGMGNSALNNDCLQIVRSTTSLEALSMSNCNLSGILFDQDLATFKNLKQLELAYTTFNNFYQILTSMASLESLSIYECNLIGTLAHQDLPKFKKLKDLDMYNTAINKNFSHIVESMTSLMTLSMNNCSLTGSLSDQGICGLQHLQKLYLSRNQLTGALPWCLANMTSLQTLYLSSNYLEGNISSSPLKVLTSIQELWLSDNDFHIPISLEPFFNNSKLKIFHGEENKIYAASESHSLAPKFQLNSITLSHCEEGGSFPKFLYHQYDLTNVYLPNMNLTGEFPSWLLDNNTKLERLSLANNSLIGPFHLPNHSHQYLEVLDISKNSFSGNIPTEIGAYLPMLRYLNISRNAFEGSIPSSMCTMKSLEYLYLSNNLLTGEIPEH